MPELMYYFSEISPEKPTTIHTKNTTPVISEVGPGILHSQFAPQIFRDHPIASGKPTRTLATLETLDR